jgi:hypothetical protein
VSSGHQPTGPFQRIDLSCQTVAGQRVSVPKRGGAARLARGAPPARAISLPRISLATALSACALVALGAAAVALRLELLARSHWLLEGDDALSTLMALGVLEGDRPIMLKNQTYAAAWEPYAMAASYALFGVSRVSAKLPALLSSLALIGTAWLLARVTVGRTAAWFAAALLAIPPAYGLVLWLKPWAPYTEVVLLGSVCLSCALAVRGAASARHLAWLAFGCGAAGGLALWMHPLAVCYLAAAAVALVTSATPRHWLAATSFGLAGFAVGGVPIWLFNLQTDGATFRFVVSGTQGASADRLAVLQAWWTNDLPRGAGLWHPWGPSPVLLGFALGALIAAALLYALFGRARLELRPLDAILAFLVLIPSVLVLSGFGGPALNPYGFDATGRYAPPIWSGLAVVLAALLAGVWRVRRWLAVCLAAVPLLVNLVGILSIDPTAAFQSPYWDRLATDNGPLLEALDAERVRAIWINHWAGQPLMFDARSAGQTLYAYDWYDVQAGGIDRFPEFKSVVESADRPAFVLVTDEIEPALERSLRLMGVTFVERRVAPYVVVMPTSRKVHPSEVTGTLDYRY